MTKSERVRVVIGDAMHYVGDLIFETDGRRQSSMFKYSNEWLNHEGGFALAPSMPLTEVPVFSSSSRLSGSSSLPCAIFDATPDSWGRGIITKALGGKPTELQFLLTVNDETRLGALRFLDENGGLYSRDKLPIPRLNTIEYVRKLAVLMENSTVQVMGQKEAADLVGYVGSLGGARPKSDFDDDGVLSIAKFTSERDTMAIERMEVATLNLASEVGIRASEARIFDVRAKYPVAIIRRFDRNEGKRRHYISAHTMLNLSGASGSSYTEIADAIREHSGREEQVLGELRELYQRILFTILVSNNDDHMKNHGFIYSGDNSWVLSPAFDINPQPERHRGLETAIIDGEPPEASIDMAIEAAPFFEVNEDQACANAGNMATMISDRWEYHARKTGMTVAEIACYAPAFNNEEMKKSLGMARDSIQIPESRFEL